MDAMLKGPMKFVAALAAVIVVGIVLYLGAALHVYAIAFVVKLLAMIG